MSIPSHFRGIKREPNAIHEMLGHRNMRAVGFERVSPAQRDLTTADRSFDYRFDFDRRDCLGVGVSGICVLCVIQG